MRKRKVGYEGCSGAPAFFKETLMLALRLTD